MKTLAFKFANFFLIGMVFLLPLGSVQATVAAPISQYPGVVINPNTALPSLFNNNLVPDGDAEAPYSTLWHDNEGFTQILPYGSGCGGMCNFPSPYAVGPTLRGTSFFYMGTTDNHSNGTNLWLNNRISLASIQAAVNTGKVRYILSGYFGGDTFMTDTAQLHVFFERENGSFVGEDIVGDVWPADRQNKTGLIYREETGFIPTGTQDINLALQAGHMSGSVWRTGFADNLSLVLIPIQMYLPLTIKAIDQPPPQTGYPAPSGVTVTKNGLTRMDISWTDNSNNELGFEVQRINQNSTVDTICNTRPNVTYCLDPGLSQNSPSGYIYLGNQTTYTYQVRANGLGIHSAWTSGSGTTAQEPLTLPSPSKGFFTCQTLDVTSSSATFVWNNPFDHEAGFNVYLGSNLSPQWSLMENAGKINIINQSPGSITLKIKPFVFDRTNPTVYYESSTFCTTTAILPAPPAGGITRFYNDSSYQVISLVVDGWERFPVRPLTILSGAYYELYGVSSGTHSWTAITGFWDDTGRRVSMYTYTGSYTQPGSGSYNVHMPDMTIQDLLSVPPANLGYWEGYYYDAGANCHSAAFVFKQNGTYTFYNSNTAIGSGTYSLVLHRPTIFSTKFHVTSTGGYAMNLDSLLVETQGRFSMTNGPSSWPQISYVYKPQGYVRNPYCP
jgi:hypothetical protein